VYHPPSGEEAFHRRLSMDAVTVRWVIVGELVVAVLFGTLVLRPDAWLYWRELVIAGIAAFVIVPIAVGVYLTHRDRKLHSARVGRVERT
jgi:hypothetical protein